MTPGKVYELSKLKKLCVKVFYFCKKKFNLEIHDFFFLNPRNCLLLCNVYNENMFTIKAEDGRGGALKPSILEIPLTAAPITISLNLNKFS